MQVKRIVLIGIAAVCLVFAGLAGGQLIPGSQVIAPLDAETRGGWVKVDKNPATASYERVYCVTLSGAPSCDWGDVRVVSVSTLSKRR